MTPEERLDTFLGKDPTIDPTAYVAPGATVIGDVRMGPRSSIWPGAVARGDINYIEIGEGSNVQDGTIVHCDSPRPGVSQGSGPRKQSHGKRARVRRLRGAHGVQPGSSSAPSHNPLRLLGRGRNRAGETAR